jgi:hypothetical protein
MSIIKRELHIKVNKTPSSITSNKIKPEKYSSAVWKISNKNKYSLILGQYLGTVPKLKNP